MLDSLHLEDIFNYAPLLGQGLITTIFLSITVMSTALVIGMLLAVVRYYRLPVLTWPSDGYVYMVRSIPLVMLIVLVHFGILPAMGFQSSFLFSAFVGLTLSTTAYVAEIFRGGFQAIHQEEHEAAKSLGLNVFQRLVYILIPLVVTRMMPTLINQFVTLIKDTSLASIIGVIELTRSAEIIYERTLHEAPLLVFVALLYFSLCYGLSRLSRHLERNSSEPIETLNWVRG
jgi:His/Glu/Gln/Arg/opine family amino acid ABC transporter permease subunit